MNSALILAIIQLIIKYGPEAVHEISKILKSDQSVTPEMIKKLFIEKSPEDYFK